MDLSIGQRLLVGFGAAALALAVLVGASHHWTERIDAEQHLLETVIAPRAAAAERLESAVLYMAVAARNVALVPSPERAQAYQRAVGRAREELHSLSELPKQAEGLALFARVPGLANEYQRESDAFVEAAKATGISPELEANLTRLREELLGLVAEYAAQQRAKAQSARSAISRSVGDLDRAVLGLGAVVMLLVALTGVLTTGAVRGPALALVGAARRLAGGDFVPALELTRGAEAPRAQQDELAELSACFGHMTLKLKAREDRLRASAALSSAMAASLDVGKLCQAGLDGVLGHLGLEVGALYLAAGEDHLRRQCALGLAGGDELLRVGEGVPGRAALGRRTVLASDIPPDSPFTVRLGIDRLPPRAVAAVPLVLQDQQVAGVVLVASLRPIAKDSIEFLEQAAAQLAVSIQNALGHQQVQALAAELQEKNEKLQAQYEEIQAQYEEIQAQYEEIQAQHEEIQAQNEELQSQNEELQTRGEELRGAVERLSSSEEALKEQDEHKNEFLAVLSHELRNPLAAISASLYLLKRTQPGSDQAARAQAIIQRQVQQLTRLVEDLLDLTRISRGKIQLRRTALELGKLVREAAEDHTPQFSARGIELTVDIGPGAIVVDGDPARLAQVVGNLLQNAAKFTPEGGRVHLAVEKLEGQAVIRVRDSGTGMDANTLGRLFAPFMQADATLARTSGGLGLGLALVKGLVEMHGGAVRAVSEGPGQGAEFVIELPTTRNALPAAPERPATPRQGKRVLVIEDNLDAANSLREALALAGHIVEVVHGGREGIERVRQWLPDVVLCDIGLPDLDGHQIAREVRADPALGAVYLVALSGYALAEDIKRAAEAGFDEHLAKPPTIEALEELLSRAVKSAPDPAGKPSS